ncbi:MAG: bifunctional methylenetetrahydrofolate dehydrogenase/methenyltetrahydrofolate cyclohydrolase FolD [Candidatus Aenigmarchaeota archaeon]|nr:bifunctional methylenetetrahydrofolate dehydrogenase/methenyltetrahydrofolate cyclohydrolase FolD [Candidatus Aenigmarchaeota archaeon]
MLLDGKKLAGEIKLKIKEEIHHLEKTPGLALILVGDDEASKIYISGKERTCKELGVYLEKYELPSEIREAELTMLIEKLNKSEKIHGILVQLPLPHHINKRVIEAIDPRKDVDGLHPRNIGRFMNGDETLVPCTPKGIMKLLDANNVLIKGKDAVVIGRSVMVGKPTAMLLLNRDSTVTICHSQTKDLQEKTKKADILVSATGEPMLIKGDMVKKGAVVVDVGISKIDGKLQGDVDFENVSNIASYITPVPGGVGPMTVAMLFENLLVCYRLIENSESITPAL